MRFLTLIAFSFALTTSTAYSAPATYQIDSAHSSAQFAVRHMMLTNVRGAFSKVTGTAVWDPADLSVCKLEANIDASTINTNEPKRDAHLKSPDFFDVAKYPTLSFASTTCQKTGGKLQIIGNFTMHGVTKPVTLDVDGPTAEMKQPQGGAKIGASATAKISRKDFGLTWNRVLESGGVAVSDEVVITIDVELVRK